LVSNDFPPDVAVEAWLTPDADLLVHRLLGDLSTVNQVAVDIRDRDGVTFLSFPDVPFDPDSGAVLIACGRHFIERFEEQDVNLRVRRSHRDGTESSVDYLVSHRLGERPAAQR